MSDLPASPKAARLASPSWLDTRLVLGVLLVLVSVVVGARVLSSADRSSTVLVAQRDIAVGTTLVAGDLVRERVRLDDGQVDRRLLEADDDDAYVGFVTRRPLDAREFVPLAALRRAGDVDERQFALNVEPGHAPPDLAGGDTVDVYVTPEDDAGGAAPAPTRLGVRRSAPEQARLVLAGRHGRVGPRRRRRARRRRRGPSGRPRTSPRRRCSRSSRRSPRAGSTSCGCAAGAAPW